MKLLILALLFIAASDLCYGKLSLNKCCNTGQSVHGRKECFTNDNDIKNLTQVKVYDTDLKESGRVDDFFVFEPGFFSDEEVRQSLWYYIRFYTSFQLIENGSVILQSRKIQDVRDPDDYCLDQYIGKNGKIAPAVYFRNPIQRNPIFYKCGFLISAIFLFLLLLVYGLLEELRNLGGKILMAYAGSLMVAYLFTFSLQIMPSNPIAIICIYLTLMIYYFMLSSFCWMGVMSYDIWWTFRGYAKARDINRRGKCFKFCMYCLIAWGVPLGLTIAVAVLNSTEKSRLPGIVKPDIPNSGCFFEDKARAAYLYGPMLVIIILNWIFFGMTVFNIWRLSRGNQILNGNAAAAGTKSAHKAQKHRFIVYLKLSVVMGLNWIMEVVSSYSPKFQGWYISDTFNVFIGLIIFIIFVCKKNVLKNLKKRLTRNKILNMSSSNSSKSRSRSTRSTLDSNSQSIALKATNPHPDQE